MKRNYIIPSTAVVALCAGFVCQVSSVQSDAGLGLGGKSTPGSPIDPM